MARPRHPALLRFCLSCQLLLGAAVAFSADPAVAEFRADVVGPRRNKAGSIMTTATLPDRRVVVGGVFAELGGKPRRNLGRLHPDGAVDESFSTSADDAVAALVPQWDGSLLVGGLFRRLSDSAQAYLGRLLPDGKVDENYQGGADYHVFAIVPLPGGGNIIGGAFQELSGQPCAFLGVVDANGNLDRTRAFGVDGPVNSVGVQADGAVIAGGRFKQVGGKPRPGLARWMSNGALDESFAPSFDGQVNCVLLQLDGRILVAGHFTLVNGRPVGRIVRLLADGRLDESFSGSVSGGSNPYVQTMALRMDGRVIVGGQFESLGGQPRQNFGVFLPNGAVDEAFRADASTQLHQTTVNSVVIENNGDLTIGGSFTNFAGLERRALARLAPDAPAPNALTRIGDQIEWLPGNAAPSPFGVVFEWSLEGTGWTTLSGASRSREGWTVSAGSVPVGATVRVRGAASGGTRTGSSQLLSAAFGPPVLAADLPDAVADYGAALEFRSWALGSPGMEFQWLRDGAALADSESISGARLPVVKLAGLTAASAGEYTLRVCNELGIVTSRPARLTVRDPVVNTSTNELIVNVGAAATLRIDAVGTPPLSYAWTHDESALAGATNSILVLTNVALADQGRYIVTVRNGSGATTVSSGIRLNVNSAEIDSFDAQPDRQILTLANTLDGMLLVGGSFSSVGGGERANFARLDAAGRLDPAFRLDADDSVLMLNFEPAGAVLVGGNFNRLGGQPRNRLARVLADGRLDADFDPNLNDAVLCSALQTDSRWLVGGLFTSVGGRPVSRLARLGSDGALDLSFGAEASFAVHALAVQPDGRILVGGQFRALAGRKCEWLGRLSAAGKWDDSFHPHLDGPVVAIALQRDGRIVVGGEFTKVNGVERRGLARLNTSGELDDGFQADADGPVMTMRSLASGELVVGGAFSKLGDGFCRGVAWLSSDGSLRRHFFPAPNDFVRALELQPDGSLVIAGSFDTISGVPRRGLARLR